MNDTLLRAFFIVGVAASLVLCSTSERLARADEPSAPTKQQSSRPTTPPTPSEADAPNTSEDEFFRRKPEKTPEEIAQEEEAAQRAAKLNAEAAERAAKMNAEATERAAKIAAEEAVARRAEEAAREKDRQKREAVEEARAARKRPSKILSATFFVLTAASAAFAIGRSFEVNDVRQSLDDTCVNRRCPASAADKIDQAKSSSVQANVGFALTAAFAAAGVFFLVRSVTRDEPPTSGTSSSPSPLQQRRRRGLDIGVGGGGLVGTF